MRIAHNETLIQITVQDVVTWRQQALMYRLARRCGGRVMTRSLASHWTMVTLHAVGGGCRRADVADGGSDMIPTMIFIAATMCALVALVMEGNKCD